MIGAADTTLAAIPRSTLRRLADASELPPTIPASMKVGGVFFMAMRTEGSARCGLRLLDLMDQFARLFQVTLIHDPHFGPCLVKWDFAHDALRIFVENPGVDARLREQATHKMRIGKRRRGIDFHHLSVVSMVIHRNRSSNP
jgi:hypothetical protein